MKLMKTALTAAIATAMGMSAAQAEISNNEIRIGYLADMSGIYRDLAGPNGLTALRMAVEEFGGSINGANIRILSADDRNSPDVASSTVRQWVERDNVDMVQGLVASSVTIAATRVMDGTNTLGLVNGSAASSITNEHCTPNHIHWTYDTYPLANGTAAAVVAEGGESWFMLTADYAFGHALENDVRNVVEANGGTVVNTVRHPLGTSDFSSYVLQAQSSGAQVVGLANAGGDTVNSIQTAGEFGLAQAGQTIAALLLFLNDVHALGTQTAQGIQLTTGWYWDMDEDARAWADRFYDRTGARPSMVQAGIYSSTMHYLKGVEATGSDKASVVREWMANNEINDMFAKGGYVREDGRMVHDMYLAEVKTPAESSGEWDLYKIVRTIPGDEAFRPLSQSQCRLVNN
ncbi:amino acid/amide ABC transporter substrate-binding protein, HAAT family (TC 3.A.1.4.-) [Marinospirillum celere]|uniref:Amino acid/amide ABC transporter substrate-binding protein, HAAT family (TC 3.A.1.4.-) n=1 Tax=Marinospirillum celere TaxID=1122252 RepID=A0A1I1JCM2_9GAMM|nr:ABC transporter substrate-binding protein [Marinospirillum celere]SFC43723.1 amino acid/amide ABC transporter substrate-binding protein, HAAT family (TC 3.A.1.4.-) [Marinospirillum celere]